MKKKIMAALLMGSMILSCEPMIVLADDTGEDVVELVYWKSYNVDAYEGLVEQFNSEHPNIHVSYEVFPDHATTLQKIQVQAATSNADMPNVIQIDSSMTAMINNLSPLIDLTPYMDKSESLKIDNFYEAFQDSGYVGDKYAGVHVCANCDLLFYNKAIFEEAGLDPDVPPTTWDEVIAYGQQIQENCEDDIIGFEYSGLTGNYYEMFSWEWEAMVESAGGSLFSDDYSAPTFNSDEGLEALQFLVGVVTDSGVATLSYPDKGFENGKLGMYMNGSWEINNFTEALGDDLGVALIPGKIDSTVMVGGDQMMIVDSGNDAVNEAAFEFLEYMMSAEVVIANSKDQGEFVAQKTIAETDEYQSYLKENPEMLAAQTALDHCSYRPRTAWYDEWSQMVYAEFEPCLYGEISCEDAISSLEEKTIELIAKYS